MLPASWVATVEVYGCGKEAMIRRRRRQAGGRCSGAGDCGGTRGKAAANRHSVRQRQGREQRASTGGKHVAGPSKSLPMETSRRCQQSTLINFGRDLWA